MLLLISILLSAMMVNADNDGLRSDSDRELIAFFGDLYNSKPMDCPARYALNQIADRKSWVAFCVLRGEWASTSEQRENARKQLCRVKTDIERGLQWPITKNEEYFIPHVSTLPVIDGNIDDHVWKNALTFKQEFPVDDFNVRKSCTVWRVLWDENNLYFGITFTDAEPIMKDYGPGDSDGLEIFILPSMQLRCYREIVIGYDGKFFSSLHVNNRYSTFVNGIPEVNATIRAVCRIDGLQVTIESAIPFSSLPNYMQGNKPKPGEALAFMMLRVDRLINGKCHFYSVRPLLYGGHNIFGYIKGTLQE